MFAPLHDSATCTNHYTGGDYCCLEAEEHAFAALEAGEAVRCACCGAIGDWMRYPIGDCFCDICGPDSAEA